MNAPTEQRHPGTTSIDTQTSLEILRALNAEDATVAAAVSEVLPELARLVDRAVESLRAGDRSFLDLSGGELLYTVSA